MKFTDYLTFDAAAVEKLDPRRQFEVLRELAQMAPVWFGAMRTQIVERMREDGHLDDAIAQRLGVSKQRISELGDGARTVDGIRQQLLRRGAAILAGVLKPSRSDCADAIAAAVRLLKPSRLSRETTLQAARCIVRAAEGLTTISIEGLPADATGILNRAIEHAKWISGEPWIDRQRP